MWFHCIVLISSISSDLRKVNTISGVSLVTTFILPLFALTINVILFSSLMLPLVKRLSEIVDLVKEIDTPVDNMPVSANGNDAVQQYQQKIREARNSIEKIYIEYESKYVQLKRYKRIFYTMLIAAISIFSYAFWPNIKSTSWVVLSYLIIAVLIYSLWLANMKPTRLASLDWLIRHARMNPFAIRAILDPGFTTSPRDESASLVNPRLCHFYLTPMTFLVGWRFYIDVVDPDDHDKVYFVAFGPYGYGKYNQRILNGLEAKYQTFIGNLSLDDIIVPPKKVLKIRFYCFLPAFKKDVLLPMYAEGAINLESQDCHYLHSSQSYKATWLHNISEDQKIVPIEYSMRWRNSLTKLDLDADGVNGRAWYGTYELFKKIKFAVQFSPSIQSYSDRRGDLINKITKEDSLFERTLLPFHRRFLTKDLTDSQR